MSYAPKMRGAISNSFNVFREAGYILQTRIVKYPFGNNCAKIPAAISKKLLDLLHPHGHFASFL